MAKALIIFIDSFPHSYLCELNYLSRLTSRQIRSGLGFSINIKAGMFAGLNCDSVGYFNEWMYTRESRFRSHRWWLKTLSPTSFNYFLDRIAHRILGKLIFRQNTLNIPFRFLPYFDKKGTVPYDDTFPNPSIFSTARNLKKITYREFPLGDDRDAKLFNVAAKMIREDSYDSVFIASADLDGLTHRCGVGSRPYLQKLNELDAFVGECAAIFVDRYPGGTVAVVSDHGMANVRGSVRFDPTDEFERPSEESYLYFTDATMLRVWSFRSEITAQWRRYLETLAGGRLLSNSERRKYHVTDPAFGDLIYILDEGFVFNPSFWGRGVPKAMHGYHPDSESQVGFICANYDILPGASEVAPFAVWTALKSMLDDSKE